MGMMSITDARKEILVNAMAGNCTMLSSPSGYGKSSMLQQVFQDWKNRIAPQTCGLGIIFAATQTPPDLVGFNFKGSRTVTLADGTVRDIAVTDPTIPLWMLDVYTGKPAFLFDKFMLIIEEYGQGEADVKRAVAEIFLNGGTPPWYLPPGSIRVAATNAGARYGVTKDFLFCISRRTQIEITPDVDALIEHLDKPYGYQGREWQTMAVTKAWAKANQTIVFEKEPATDGPWCNPRTLCAADRYLQCKQEVAGALDPSNNGTISMLAGTIGMPATQSFVAHLQFMTQLPSYEEVVRDPAGCPVPTKADLLMLMSYQMAGQTKPEHLPQVLTYMGRMPKDMGITFVTSLLRRDYKGIINQPAMTAWIGKNSALISIISSLSK